jgi:hypothetical protein
VEPLAGPRVVPRDSVWREGEADRHCQRPVAQGVALGAVLGVVQRVAWDAGSGMTERAAPDGALPVRWSPPELPVSASDEAEPDPAWRMHEAPLVMPTPLEFVVLLPLAVGGVDAVRTGSGPVWARAAQVWPESEFRAGPPEAPEDGHSSSAAAKAAPVEQRELLLPFLWLAPELQPLPELQLSVAAARALALKERSGFRSRA